MSALSFEDFQKLSKQQVETATAVAATLSKGFQEIATEASDYAKHSMSVNAETIERLFGAKTVEAAVQIQTDYAKTAYDAFIAKATKMNEIITKLASETMKPAQNAFAAVATKA